MIAAFFLGKTAELKQKVSLRIGEGGKWSSWRGLLTIL
jgi:hypothetical protein